MSKFKINVYKSNNRFNMFKYIKKLYKIIIIKITCLTNI